MRVLQIKTCDTCRKALKSLRNAGHEPEVVDVAGGISQADLAQITAQFGDAAVNTASATWRGLSPNERAKPVEDILTAHPKAMKRPMIEADGHWYRGWGPEVQAALLDR